MAYKYATINKMAELSGYTHKALEKKIETGVFLQGRHYLKSPDGRIQFIISAVESWIEGKTRHD